MLPAFATLLVLIAFSAFALQFFARARQLSAAADCHAPMPVADRYRPMLRLLSTDDCALLSGNKRLAKQFRTQRCAIFREYLRCLTKDYGRLLASVRVAMLRAGTDRPDLARALAVNKMRFIMTMCRIEFRLRLHEAGFGTVDVSGLVDAMDALRVQVSFARPSALAAR
jgi:hypothetical protein